MGKCLQQQLHHTCTFQCKCCSVPLLYSWLQGCKQTTQSIKLNTISANNENNQSYFKCIHLSVEYCIFPSTKCCPVLKWTVLSRVSKCLQNCCNYTECYWWWTLTETGIHEYQKKWSLNTFCIKAMQKYPKFSSLVNGFSVLKKCTWYWDKCENDCRNLGLIEIMNVWMYESLSMNALLSQCNGL